MLTPPLTNSDYLKSILTKAGIRPARSAGQHFLICEEACTATTLALDGGPKKITELGAGLGTLTQVLLAAGYSVRAIERDPDLAAILRREATPRASSNLTLEIADLRATPWPWDELYQLVGNIPYNLSGLIIRRLTQLTPAPAAAVFLLQHEVGLRLTATPPDMHLVTLAVQLWGSVHHLLHVPKTCFWPTPQVDSTLVLLVPHTDVATTRHEREAIIKFAKPLFQNRRKQLAGTLTAVTGRSRPDIAALLAKQGIAATARPQELSVDQWQKLHAEVTGNL